MRVNTTRDTRACHAVQAKGLSRRVHHRPAVGARRQMAFDSFAQYGVKFAVQKFGQPRDQFLARF